MRNFYGKFTRRACAFLVLKVQNLSFPPCTSLKRRRTQTQLRSWRELLSSHPISAETRLRLQYMKQMISFKTHVWKILFFLSLVSIPNQLVDTQVGMRSVTQGNGCRGSSNLLHHNAVTEVRRCKPAILHCE